jgi:hypothetical protein
MDEDGEIDSSWRSPSREQLVVESNSGYAQCLLNRSAGPIVRQVKIDGGKLGTGGT